MYLPCKITLPDHEYERFLQLAAIDLAKTGDYKGIVLTLGQDDQYKIKLNEKRLYRDIIRKRYRAKEKKDKNSFWSLDDEALRKFNKPGLTGPDEVVISGWDQHLFRLIPPVVLDHQWYGLPGPG